MSDLAIALCRVSTAEQLENNSLNRQEEAVLRCAKEKGVEIIRWWSGSVSSKRGNNLKRKDLKEMLDTCRKDKRIKYLFIDEPDRFMRSIDEAFYFEVEFGKYGVKVWYASDAELNSDNLMAKMYRFMKYFNAEGSNEERIGKSVSGGKKSLREGRLLSHPKAGYKKGLVRGVHVIDEPVALTLQRALKQVAHDLKTPRDALKELMTTEFGKRRPRFKMDKFRKVACDCYYYGAVELKGKLNERTEQGLHRALITKAEHEKILRVFERNPKNQQGQRLDKNLKYPLSNDLTCIKCDSASRKYPRFCSVPLNNGKTNHGKQRKKVSYYEKYRCREPYMSMERSDAHDSFSALLNSIILPEPELKKLKHKLVATFNAKHIETRGEIQRLEAANTSIRQTLVQKAEAAIDPAFSIIRDEILDAAEKLKTELEDNQRKIELLSEQHETDLGEFLDFSFGFLSNKGTHFFELNGTDMKWCKQMIFRGKIYVDENKNIYTHDISPIFRGQSNKKDLSETEKSFMVDFYNQVRTEFERSA